MADAEGNQFECPPASVEYWQGKGFQVVDDPNAEPPAAAESSTKKKSTRKGSQ